MPIMFPLAEFFRDIKLDANQIAKSRNTKLPGNVSSSPVEFKQKVLGLNNKESWYNLFNYLSVNVNKK